MERNFKGSVLFSKMVLFSKYANVPIVVLHSAYNIAENNLVSSTIITKLIIYKFIFMKHIERIDSQRDRDKI